MSQVFDSDVLNCIHFLTINPIYFFWGGRGCGGVKEEIFTIRSITLPNHHSFYLQIMYSWLNKKSFVRSFLFVLLLVFSPQGGVLAQLASSRGGCLPRVSNHYLLSVISLRFLFATQVFFPLFRDRRALLASVSFSYINKLKINLSKLLQFRR